MTHCACLSPQGIFESLHRTISEACEVESIRPLNDIGARLMNIIGILERRVDSVTFSLKPIKLLENRNVMAPTVEYLIFEAHDTAAIPNHTAPCSEHFGKPYFLEQINNSQYLRVV